MVSGLAGESMLKIAHQAVPFVLFMLMVVLLIAFIPSVSTVMLDDVFK